MRSPHLQYFLLLYLLTSDVGFVARPLATMCLVGLCPALLWAIIAVICLVVNNLSCCFHLDSHTYDHIASAGIIKHDDSIFPCISMLPHSE